MNGREYICTQCHYLGQVAELQKKAIAEIKRKNVTEFFCGFGKLGGLVLFLMCAVMTVAVSMELIAFAIFLVPAAGVAYLVFRFFAKNSAAKNISGAFKCPSCSNVSMIPTDSPRGKALKEEMLQKMKPSEV